MIRINVIDNGGQWTHREWRTLRDLGVDTKIIPNTESFKEIFNNDIDGFVLSGGSPRIGITSDLGKCNEYLEKSIHPILGICAGHQFMGRYYGGVVKPSKTPEFGKVELTLLKENDSLFDGVPKESIVWESHNDEISVLPDSFELLAESRSCKIQAMRHLKKQFYGLQFHPEVEHTEYGQKIFNNFLQICKK